MKKYMQYTDCDHSLCIAYILREINGISELEKQLWAEPINLLNTLNIYREKILVLSSVATSFLFDMNI